MDIKKLEEIFEPSAMKVAKENQARLASLSLAAGATDNILKTAKDLDYFKRLTDHIVTKNLLSQTSPINNLLINSEIVETVKKLTESNAINASLLESLKLNKYFIDIIESAKLDLKPPTQSIFVKGIPPTSQVGELGNITFKITEALKQYEQFGELESFKAISRLDNFPFEDIKSINLVRLPDSEEKISKTIIELDSEISDELSLVDDFNELSEERRTILLEIYQAYYYPIILNCLVIIMWLQVFLDERLDLTNNTFIFVEKSKEKLSYLGNVCRPKPSGVIEGVIGSAIFTLIMKVFG